MREKKKAIQYSLTKRAGKAGGWPGVTLLILFAVQFAVICFFNLTQIKNHIGVDASWNLLKAALVWKEKTLIHPMWVDTTSLSLDNSLVIAAPLYGLTGNLTLSFGIANLLTLLMILTCVWLILHRLDVRFSARMIVLNLIVCPYLVSGFALENDLGFIKSVLSTSFVVVNDLGYFSTVLGGAAFYNWRVLIALLVVLVFVQIRQNRRTGILGAVTLLLCAWSGISSGIYLIVMMFAPYLIYEVEAAMILNDRKQLIRKDAGFAVLGSLFTLAGAGYTHFILRFDTISVSRTWTAYQNLGKNFGAALQGFIKLIQALPAEGQEEGILSRAGFFRACPILILLAFVICIGYFAVRVFRKDHLLEEKGIYLFLLNIVFLNFAFFGMFNVTYGAAVFEERYLITTFFVAVLLVGLFFSEMSEKGFAGTVMTLVMILAIAGTDYQSDRQYMRVNNDGWQLDQIQEMAETNDAGLVCFWGEELESVGKIMRAYDPERIYKIVSNDGGRFFCFDMHKDDYLYGERKGEYEGPTMFVAGKEKNEIWEDILSRCTLVGELDEVNVYLCPDNPIPWLN